MRKYFFIALGGAAGAVSRYLIKTWPLFPASGAFPVNTLFINVSGSFLLALLLTVALEVWSMDGDIRLGIASGFLGAYTTFSTLCKESVTLFADGHPLAAASYMLLSAFLGLLAAYLGTVLARQFVRRKGEWAGER